MMLYYSAMETVNNFWVQICLLSRGRENQCAVFLKQAPDSFIVLKKLLTSKFKVSFNMIIEKIKRGMQPKNILS